MADTVKEKFALAVVRCVQAAGTAMDAAPDLVREYFACGYSGITDADVERLGITAADLVNCITLMQNLDKFFTNQAVTQGDHQVTVNKVKRAG